MGKTARIAQLFACAALLAACQTGRIADPGTADLTRELVRADPGPPEGPAGACWEADITPAVIETTTEQVMISTEVRAADGTVLKPAVWRTDTRQRIAQEREVVWFRAPCPQQMTEDFVATLQRALLARGYYTGPLTGQLDAATSEAVRRWQADRGLDSPRLSLGAARQLGLVTVPLEEL